MSRVIVAERNLMYSTGDGPDRMPFSIRVSKPEPLTAPCGFDSDPGAASCRIEWNGLPEPDIEVHGIDTLHALAQASAVDAILGGLERKYRFYWLTGEPYFEGTLFATDGGRANGGVDAFREALNLACGEIDEAARISVGLFEGDELARVRRVLARLMEIIDSSLLDGLRERGE